MKKHIVLLFSTLLLVPSLLTACGTNNRKSSNINTETTEKLPTSTKINNAIAKSLEKELNKDGKVATVRVEPETYDENSAKKKDGSTIAHQEIEARITDKGVIKKYEEDGDDGLFAEGIKEIADEFHSKLKGHDVINIGYDIDKDQSMTIAEVNTSGRIVK